MNCGSLNKGHTLVMQAVERIVGDMSVKVTWRCTQCGEETVSQYFAPLDMRQPPYTPPP
jgi:hypothetical protein